MGSVARHRSTILPLALLTASTTICYIDRQALSIAAPTLRSEFGMSNFSYSTVLFAFLLAYAAFNPLIGRWIDRIGTRLGLALAVIFWSAAGMLHALASGPLSLGIFRFLLGAGEAANFPACIKRGRRSLLQSMAFGSGTVLTGLSRTDQSVSAATERSARGMPTVRIQDVSVIDVGGGRDRKILRCSSRNHIKADRVPRGADHRSLQSHRRSSPSMPNWT